MRKFMLIAQAALAATALTASACAPIDSADYDPHQRFQNKVEARELTMTVKPGGPDAQERAILRSLARDYLRRPAAPVQVSGPAPDAQAAKTALVEMGIGAENVAIVEKTGPVEVSAPVWFAVIPECGTWDEPITTDRHNQNTWNFGCAVTRNIGLMASDPADLVRAREMSGRNAARAVDVLDKYGQGKATSSAAENGAVGTLSTVGK